MPPIRTFIAFETPEQIRKDILAVQTTLKTAHADVKWESIDKFHVTIKFLGDVEEGLLPKILSVVGETVTRFNTFDIMYNNLGCFPNLRSPKVLWVGCENRDGTLLSFKNELDSRLSPFGFEIEKRAFHPHLTLGRVKGESGIKDLTSMLKSITFEPRTAMINTIVVMKSDLRPGGSLYTSLQQTELHS